MIELHKNNISEHHYMVFIDWNNIPYVMGAAIAWLLLQVFTFNRSVGRIEQKLDDLISQYKISQSKLK